MKVSKNLEIWFVTGSQHLYGKEALTQVAKDSSEIAGSLNAESAIPYKIVDKPTVTTAEEVKALCREANADQNCLGLVLWMHTFSPAKMWIAGLLALDKPILHLHTQFNLALPWSSIDMDFMNLHQAAHGDREFGFLTARLKLARKVVVGFWKDPETILEVAAWTRAAAGWRESQNLKIARFGDNMRDVAVTEGDKVAAQAQLGYSVNGYGVGDLVDRIKQSSDAEVSQACRRLPRRLLHRPRARSSRKLERRGKNRVGPSRFSDRGATSARSPIPFRTCMGWTSCPASQCNG